MGHSDHWDIAAMAVAIGTLVLAVWLATSLEAPASPSEVHHKWVAVEKRPMGDGVTCYIAVPKYRPDTLAMSCLKD